MTSTDGGTVAKAGASMTGAASGKATGTESAGVTAATVAGESAPGRGSMTNDTPARLSAKESNGEMITATSAAR